MEKPLRSCKNGCMVGSYEHAKSNFGGVTGAPAQVFADFASDSVRKTRSRLPIRSRSRNRSRPRADGLLGAAPPAPALIPRVFFFAKQGRPTFMQAQIRSLAAEVMRLPISLSDGLETVPDQQLGELLPPLGRSALQTAG